MAGDFLKFIQMDIKSDSSGVPVVAQQKTNPTSNHEVTGSIPVPTQWVKDPALP